MKKQFGRILPICLFICLFNLTNAWSNDTLKVIIKLKVVNGLFTYNKSTGPDGELDLLWALRFDTDNNTSTGLNGFDLELSLTHFKESGGMKLGNILQATRYNAWKLSASGKTLIDSIIAEMNVGDTTLIIKALKTIPEIAKVKEGNRFMAISFIKGTSGIIADSTSIGIVPATINDARGDCSSTINDILMVQVINANKASGLNLEHPSGFVRIYPQPMKNYCTVEINENISQPVCLKIINSQGQVVKVIDNIHQNTIILERNGLQQGLYFYQLSTAGEVITEGKLIIAD